MADSKETNSNCVYIAIDIAKNKHDVLIKHADGQKMSFKIENTLHGYQQIVDRGRQLSKDATLICGFEPTADYHRNIAYWLSSMGCEMRLISSLACARAREMLHKTWDKNDRKDAGVILYLLEHGINQPNYDPLINGNMDAQEMVLSGCSPSIMYNVLNRAQGGKA